MTAILTERDAEFLEFVWQDEQSYANQQEISSSKTGYFPAPPRITFDGLSFLLSNGLARPGASVLDLGSGLGMGVRVASYMGFRGYGLEIDEELVAGHAVLNERAADLGFIPKDAMCRSVAGSYFPAGYVGLRKGQKSVAQKYELSSEGQSMLFPVADRYDPYMKLGLGIVEADIFLCYAYALQLPSVYEIFSLYARDDALMLSLCLRRPYALSRFTRELGLDAVQLNEHLHEPLREPYSLFLVRKK